MKFSIQKRPDFLHKGFESCQKCKNVEMNFDGGSDHCAAPFIKPGTQTIKERRSYERCSERRSRFHERDMSAAHIFNHERKNSAAHSIS